MLKKLLAGELSDKLKAAVAENEQLKTELSIERAVAKRRFVFIEEICGILGVSQDDEQSAMKRATALKNAAIDLELRRLAETSRSFVAIGRDSGIEEICGILGVSQDDEQSAMKRATASKNSAIVLASRRLVELVGGFGTSSSSEDGSLPKG